MQMVFREQMDEFIGTRLLPVVYNRCLLTPVLADIETEGLQLDPALVRTRFDELKVIQEDLTRKMNEMTGGINPNSHPQVTAFLYDTLGFEEIRVKKGGKWVPKTTDSGLRCKDADTVLELEAKTAKQVAFKELYIALNDVNQELSKYFEKFQRCCDEVGGVLYANFNQTNTFTHRLSCTGREYSAQFQNFPRQWKKLFTARRPGYLMGEADGAQLEFRVAGHLGRDAVALGDIDNNVDVHSVTASVLTAAGEPTDRQGAKPFTFRPLYGGSSGTPAVQAYCRAFKEKYKGIAEAQEGWIYHVLENGWLETEWGLRYYWPNTRMDRSGYITNTTSICNYPVQAFATAEIIPLAVVAMWHITKRLGCRIHLVNTIHDSIIAEVHPDDVELFKTISRFCLIDAVYLTVQRLYDIKLVVRLGCGVKVATHWGHTKEETKYEAPVELYKEAA
jgi:DNA polymerase I-like protein with 3'-5' exonuclease and polymerase domains